MKFSVKRNEEMQERKGTITIKNSNYNLVVELYVTQKAFVPELTVEPESLSFAVEGGTQEITITANLEYTYTTDADWVVLNKTINGLEVTVQNAVAFENRMAEVIISSDRYEVSKKVCISQKALSKDATNVIFYTSNNGEIVVPYKMDVFGANIMSNTYNNGMGLIFFDAPVTSIGYGAFYYCNSLTSVYCKSTTAPSVCNDTFYEVKDEKTAHKLIEKRKAQHRLDLIKKGSAVTLDDLFNKIKDGELINLDVVLRADVKGSAEAVKESLEKLSNEEVRVRVIASNTGEITESDITLAKVAKTGSAYDLEEVNVAEDGTKYFIIDCNW